MESYKNILVVVEEQNFVTKAIARATTLAGYTNGKVIILLLKNNNFVSRLSTLSKNKQKPKTTPPVRSKDELLQHMIIKLAQKGINVNPELLSCYSYADILKEAQNKDTDTIVVSASKHNFWFKYQTPPVDEYLIGISPYPLLIVKEHTWHKDGHILSAVELFNNKVEHQKLTEKVLEESEHFVQLLGGDCHMVDCYYGEKEDMSFNYIQTETNQDIHLSIMKKYCHDHHLQEDNIHLSLELPENAIKQLSIEVDSELVIVGDCGHRGLLSKFSTHVSEEVLNNINCDLLVLKP